MTVKIANTELTSNFNTWRLNTNLIATTISNNVVTVAKEGRGGYAVGDGHVSGTLSATTLATSTLKSGNTSDSGGWLYVTSNTSINATSLAITSNTSFAGNVDFNVDGTNRLVLPDISRIRISGGNRGQYLRKIGSDQLDFESLTLRQITDLSSNSAHLILSGANTSFSDNGDSVHLVFGSGALDHIHMYLAKDAIGGDSDLFLNLADTDGDSRFVIADSSNTVVGYIDSDGNADFSGTLTADGATTLNGDVTLGDVSTDTITVKGNFANQSTSGAATFNGATTFNGTSTFNGTMNINGNVNVGDAASDIMNVTSRSDLFGATNIGDANTDTVTVLAEVDSNFVPAADSTYMLGKTTKAWKKLFVDDIYNTTMTATGAVGVGSLTSTGSATFNGDVTLGDSTADTITVKGNFANQHTEGLATFGGTVGIETGTVTAGYQLEVNGKAKINDDAAFGQDVTVGGDLTVTGAITVPGNLVFQAGVGRFANLYAYDTVELGDTANDTISMTGSISISGDVDHDGSLDVSGTFSNDGTIVVSKNGKIHANNAITNGTIRDIHLENSGVTAGSYGDASSIPVITVNSKGLVDSISTTASAGVTGLTYTQSNNNIKISTATGTTYDDVIDAATTTSGTGRGVASFDSGDFSVSSGHVSLKNATTGAVLAINGTSNEVNVSRTNGTVTVGLPDDVTVSGQLNVGENVVISGNLVVSGTTTTVNTETVNIADNLIVLNSNYTGSLPSENGGIEIERGTQANKTFIWDETNDRWTVGSETMVAQTFIGSLTGNASSATKLATARSIGISLSGDVTGSGSASFDGTGNITISATNMTVQPNSVALGTDTTGNYVATAAAGNGIGVTGSGSETASITVTNTKPFDYITIIDGDGTSYTQTNQDSLTFAEGSGIDTNFTADDVLTITNTDRGSSQNIFKNIAVSGQTTVVADSNNDTLTFVNGNKITITTNATNDSLTVAHNDTSTLSGAYGGSGISGITVDDAGHVTAVSTATYDNYVSWTARADSGTDDAITSGEIVDFIGGTSITTSVADAGVTINHADTSTLSGTYGRSSTEDGTYVKSVTVDGLGHLTAVTTDDFDDRYLGISAKAADSNLLDGIDSSAFLRSNANDTASGLIIFSNTTDATSTTAAAVELSGGLAVAKSVYIGGTLYETSDERTKSNIQKIDNAVDKVMNLNGYTFDKEGSETRQTGVIAQEVAKVLPEAIGGNENEMTVAYGNMVGLLIEAIKEQQKQIDNLKKRLL
jgi:hypothetical protein